MRGDLGDFLRRYLLAFAMVAALLLLTHAGAIIAWRFPDPDDALRLVELRDWLGGQGWYDVTQHRIDPAHGGVAMHWSRLVDLPLAAVVLVLRPLLGGAMAGKAALLIVPMLTLAIILLLLARVAWERLGAEASTLCALVLAMSVPVVMQVRPLRIDHHGWQIVAAVLAMNGLMTRHARAGGFLSGGAMALGLAISVEGLPLTAVFGAIGAWRWWRGGETKLWLVHFAAALAAVSAACFAATRWGDVAQHCDAIAPVHLAVFACGAAGLWAMARTGLRGFALIAGFALLGGAMLGLYLGVAPQCRAGSFNMLDPLVRQMWYEGVPEGLPIWKQDWTTALQIAVPPLAGLLACFALMRVSVGDELVWWREYALLLGGALVIALALARAGAVAGAYAAVPLAWMVQQGLAGLRKGPLLQRLARGLGLVLALMPSAPIALYGLLPTPKASVATVLARSVADCRVAQGAAILAQQKRGVVLAPLDLGPDLLLATQHSVMATGHHRGAQAIHDNLLAFISPPDQAQGLLRAYGVTYVALCPALATAQNYAAGGLAQSLIAGRAPTWLEPLPNVPGEGLRVWRVKPE